jgi:hypothetical protein
MTKQAEDDARGFVLLPHISTTITTLQPICMYFVRCGRRGRLLHPGHNINSFQPTMTFS